MSTARSKADAEARGVKWDGFEKPAPVAKMEHVSFVDVSFPVEHAGVCMFCSMTAFFQFDTGEPVCEECRK